MPVTPFFPFLGPLGAVPLPFKIDIYFGEPKVFEGNLDAPETEVQAMVDEVKDAIQEMLDEGVARRPVLKILTSRTSGGPS